MLQIIVLNGTAQGETVDLFEGLKINSSADAGLQIKDSSFQKNGLNIICNPNGTYSLFTDSGKAEIEVGGDLFSSTDLMPGLIFSVAEIGFSIQEGVSSSTTTSSKIKQNEFFELLEYKNQQINKPSIQTFLVGDNVSFRFVRGVLLDLKWSLPWQPMSFGSHTTFYHFIDDLIPSETDFLTFSVEEGGAKILSTKLPSFVSINGKPLALSTEIFHGDLVEFANTAFYVDIEE